MDLTNFYFREVVGSYPFETEREEARTRCTIAYLLESGIPAANILPILVGLGSKKYIEPDDLPEDPWKGSLIERDVYYCHHLLQLVPPDPIIRQDGTFKEFPFYREIRARFLMRDLVHYFYYKIGNIEFRDEKRHGSQFDHMLKKYRINGIESLDIILFMIDEASYQHIPVSEPFDIASADIISLALRKTRHIMDDRHAKGVDKIFWRNYLVEDVEIAWQTN